MWKMFELGLSEKKKASLGCVALESTDLTVTKIWSGRRSKALWSGGTLRW
jgi:hypothetical protein